MTVNPVPEHLTTVTPRLAVPDAIAALDFYAAAFGAEEIYERFCAPDGTLIHTELRIGDAVVMVTGDEGYRALLATYWPDVDTAWERALAAGATVVYPLADHFYGDVVGACRIPLGSSGCSARAPRSCPRPSWRRGPAVDSCARTPARDTEWHDAHNRVSHRVAGRSGRAVPGVRSQRLGAVGDPGPLDRCRAHAPAGAGSAADRHCSPRAAGRAARAGCPGLRDADDSPARDPPRSPSSAAQRVRPAAAARTRLLRRGTELLGAAVRRVRRSGERCGAAAGALGDRGEAGNPRAARSACRRAPPRVQRVVLGG